MLCFTCSIVVWTGQTLISGWTLLPPFSIRPRFSLQGELTRLALRKGQLRCKRTPLTSRLQIPAPSLAHFPSVFRRLSRIFSHAYFHHRETFSLAEAETSLYARFVALCERFALIGSNLLVIPKEATQSGRGDEEDEMEHGRERRSGAEGEVDAELDIDSDSSSSEEEEDDELDNGIGAGTGGRGGHSATSSRGRDKDGEAGGRRPHSLDRHPRPHQFETLQHPEATAASTTTSTSAQPQTQTPQHTHTPLHQIKIRGWSPADIPVATKSSPTTATSTSNPSFDPESMANPVVSGGSLRDRAGQGMTMGRNTLGRNKGRGTMLWSSDSDIPPPLPEKMAAPPVSAPVSHPVAPEEPIASASEAPASETDANISAAYEHGSGLARSESAASTDTAIFTPHQDEQGHISVTSTIAPDPVASVPGGATTADKEEVGKDEIELLQEQGKLEQIPSEAPLAVAPASDTEMAKTAGETDVPPAAEDHEEDLLEEVDLKDANEQDNHGDDKVDASSSAAELGSSAAADVTGEGEGEESIESEVSPSTDTNAHDDKDGNDTSKPDASSADTASAIANKEKGKDGKTDSVDDGGDDKATNGETSEGKE